MAQKRIAVLGAGIVGCMVARELASRSPQAKIVVLDRDLAGSGASRRSAGLHIPRGATERVRRMASYSQSYYRDMVRADPDLPIHPLEMSIVADPESAGDVEAIYLDEARLERVAGVPGDLVCVPRGAAVWQGDGCQHADVHALVQALARDLRSRVAVREGVSVASVAPRPGGVAVTLGTGESLAFDRVVIAPGPWLTAPAWKELVAPLGARVKKVVAMHLQIWPSASDRAVIFHDEDAFLLPLADRGHWLFSYTCREWDVDPDALTGGLSERLLDDARACLRRYAPALVARCDGGRVFCDAYSTTGEPIVQALDDDERIVFAGAANGSGYRLAPAMAADAADLLLHQPLARSFA